MSNNIFRTGSSFLGRANLLLGQLNGDMKTLQRQLATGRYAESYGELSRGRITALSLRERLTGMETYGNVIQQVDLRVTMMESNLGRLDDIRQEAKQAAVNTPFQLTGYGQTVAQTSAFQQLDEAINLLNTDIAGRTLFGGRKTDARPVESVSKILNGDGTKAGLKTMIEQRRLADLGTDQRGRMGATSAGAVVTLAEDGAHPFGFKIDGISLTSSFASVSGPTGSPQSATITVGSLPANGEIIRISLDLPDGSNEAIELSAGTANSATTFAVGANTTDTATNITNAIQQALLYKGQTALTAASGFAAADNFFLGSTSTPPLRVDGPPFETATALRNATAADTVVWYNGDSADASTARTNTFAQVDTNVQVNYGVQANEAGVTDILKGLAVFTSIRFTNTDATSNQIYDDLRLRAAEKQTPVLGRQAVNDIRAELIHTQTVLKSTNQRQTASKALIDQSLSSIELIDPNEVGIKLLSLQTRIEASYALTQRVSQLSLVNYLN